VNVSLAMRVAGVTAVGALGLAACGSNSNGGSSGSSDSANAASSSSCGSGSLTAQGSTFQQTLEQQLSSQFTSQCSGAQITYTGTGSSTGIQQFGAGKVDFAGSDVTMAPSEQQAANAACGSTALTLPITSGGVAIIYNLKGVSGLKLSATTLADIFTGKVKTWNDPEIKADNSGASLPSTPITTFHRADGSGTTSVLTGFLNAIAPKAWTPAANKVWPSGLPGQAATGSSGVTQGVSKTNGGITYAEVSYAKQSNLPTAAVKGPGSSYVDISADSVSQSIDSGFTVTGTGDDLAGSLSFAKMTGYPISTVSYVLVCSTYKDAGKAKLLKSYLTYAAGTGQQQANSLGFAPLPSDLATKVQASVASIS
jgi:phosphate transport system substrate-binding protein